MAELRFKKIEMSDREQAMECLSRSGFRGCEYTFGNNFVWRNIYDIEVCFAEGFYFCKQNSGKNTRFIFPAGNDDIEKAVYLMKDYTFNNDLPLRFIANKDTAEKISQLFDDCSVTLNRDYCDYIYNADDLENLSGKKYHAKRNHLNRFYENNWSFEPITPDNIPECMDFLTLWKNENIVESDNELQSKLNELSVTECSLRYFEQLGYSGGVLRVDGEIQGFTVGEKSAENCFVVHIEKALRKYQGSYAAINREFVKSLNGRYEYINREDDAGSENLRKAKLSYKPVFLEEKFDVCFGGRL